MKIVNISIGNIQVPETRITSYMEEDMARELESSLQTAGILEPLLVIHENGVYTLVNGLHRLQAAKVRGDATVPCVVKPGTYRDVILQNIATSWLHGRPKQSEVRKVVQLLEEEFALDAIGIHRKLGISQITVENLMWVNQAVPAVQEALDEGDLPLGAAVAIARIPSQEAQKHCLLIYEVHHPKLVLFTELCDKVRLDLAEPVDENLETEPVRPHARITTAPCDACTTQTPFRHLRPLMICPSCYGHIWSTLSIPIETNPN